MDFSHIEESFDEENPTFHYYYNREERLAHAPKIVQDHYNGTGPKIHKNLFAWLVSSPFNKMLFLMLIAFSVLTFVLFRAMPDSWQKDIGKVSTTLTSFSYADKVYASLTCSPKPETTYVKRGFRRIKVKKIPEPEQKVDGESTAVPVSVTFFALDENQNVITQSILFVEPFDGKEMAIRTEFTDYDIVSVRAEITAYGESATVSRKVQKH